MVYLYELNFLGVIDCENNAVCVCILGPRPSLKGRGSGNIPIVDLCSVYSFSSGCKITNTWAASYFMHTRCMRPPCTVYLTESLYGIGKVNCSFSAA